MLRGAQKQMIVVRTHGNRVFEEAYFVIRRDAASTDQTESDMLLEANRIIEASLPRSHSSTVMQERREAPAFGLVGGLIWFAMGFASGAALLGLLWLIL